MSEAERPLIYVLDDEQVIASTVAMILKQKGDSARAFSNPLDVLQACKETVPAVLVNDVVMLRCQKSASPSTCETITLPVGFFFFQASSPPQPIWTMLQALLLLRGLAQADPPGRAAAESGRFDSPSIIHARR